MPSRPPGFPDPRFRSHNRGKYPAPPAKGPFEWKPWHNAVLALAFAVGLLVWGWLRSQ